MILADKIIQLRKKCGWSQEELAEKMNVSRQSISKWEGTQSVPDLDKIIKLSQIFGVSTDYLLKDELNEEKIEYSDNYEPSTVKKISVEEANEYMEKSKTASWRKAIATVLCILSPITLIFLAGLSEQDPGMEGPAVAIGLTVLLVLVTVGVVIFIYNGIMMKEFAYIEEPFETEYGVKGIV